MLLGVAVVAAGFDTSMSSVGSDDELDDDELDDDDEELLS